MNEKFFLTAHDKKSEHEHISAYKITYLPVFFKKNSQIRVFEKNAHSMINYLHTVQKR